MMQEIQMLKSQVEMLQGELGRVKVSDDTQSRTPTTPLPMSPRLTRHFGQAKPMATVDIRQ